MSFVSLGANTATTHKVNGFCAVNRQKLGAYNA